MSKGRIKPKPTDAIKHIPTYEEKTALRANRNL
jgi:hypothetical protein